MKEVRPPARNVRARREKSPRRHGRYRSGGVTGSTMAFAWQACGSRMTVRMLMIPIVGGVGKVGGKIDRAGGRGSVLIPPIQPTHRVIPAKAGISVGRVIGRERMMGRASPGKGIGGSPHIQQTEVPAFAGMTRWVEEGRGGWRKDMGLTASRGV